MLEISVPLSLAVVVELHDAVLEPTSSVILHWLVSSLDVRYRTHACVLSHVVSCAFCNILKYIYS